MADNKVLVEFEIVQKGKSISVVQKETEKLTKSQDKAAASQKRLSKQQEMGYGRQKQGLVQTANSTKNFSKLANTIDGGGGGTSLVGAYATLAANVFAASAAFNALSRAAQFQQLSQGLELIGAQSGRSLGLLAQNLREATGGALSLEQASRGAAIGISGGFGSKELEGLAKIARGASLALGRDLADAFDRLTRGAIKLEPEILDELGIMVRLDDAVEAYAASLGKPANALSQLERRQAFMNAILEQGELKFGEIAEAVDPTPYQKLGASFADLTKDFFSFINETLNLNSVVEFMAGNIVALTGVIIAFGSTIATQMIPALGNQAGAARAAAEAASEMAEAALKNSDDILEASRAAFLAYEGGAGTFEQIRQAALQGTKSTVDYEKALRSLNASHRARQKQIDANNVKDMAAAEQKQRDLKEQILLTEQLRLAEQNRAASQITANLTLAKSNLAASQANNLEDFSTGQIGLAAALGANSKNVSAYFDNLEQLTPATNRFQKANRFLEKGFKKLGGQVKLLTTFLSKYIFVIGAIIVAAGVLFQIYDKIFNTPEQKAYNEQVKKLDKVLEGVAKKAEEYEKAISGALPPAIAQQRQYEILGNTIKEINSELQKAIKLQADLQRGTPEGFGRDFGERNLLQRGVGNTGSPYSDIANFGEIQNLRNTPKLLAEELPSIFGESTELAKKVIENGNLDQSLRNLFVIDDTPQYKAFLEALRFPEYSDFLLNSEALNFSEIFTLDPNAEDSQQKLLDLLVRMGVEIDKADKRFGGLAGTTISFANTLKEVEKSSSQFVQKFFPKTSVSQLLSNLKQMQTEIKAVNDASNLLPGSDQNEEVGKLLTQAGPQVRKLLGPVIDEQISQVSRLQRTFEGMTEEEKKQVNEATGLTKEMEIQTEISSLLVSIGEQGTLNFKENLKVIKEIQDQEVLRKQTLEKMGMAEKVIQSAQKQSLQATEQIFDMEREKFDFERKERNTKLNFQAQELKLGIKINDNETNRLQVIQKLKQKRDELVANGGDENKIAGINLVLAEEENAVLARRLQTITETNRLKITTNQLALETLKVTEKQNQLDLKNAKIAVERENRARGGTGALSPLQSAILTTKEEQKRRDLAEKRVEAEKNLIAAQTGVIIGQLIVIREMQIATGKTIEAAKTLNTIMDVANSAFQNMNALDIDFDILVAGMGEAIEREFSKIFGKEGDLVQRMDETLIAVAQAQQTGTNEDNTPEENRAERIQFSLQIMRKAFNDFGEDLERMFGEDGKVIGALSRLAGTFADVAISISQAFGKIDDAFNKEDSFFKDIGMEEGKSKTLQGLMKFAAVTQGISAIISGFSEVMQADADRRTAAIDKQIEQEKKLDGKSAASLAKIQAMEKKKESIERKQFERNKKMQIANAIISTASAAASTYAAISSIPGVGPFLAPAMAASIIALGMAQIAIIRKTQFSGGGDGAAAPSTALSIGKRSNAVDVSAQATGGELNYLRGGRTDGSNLGGAGASLPGAAMGRKGYADGGVIVGERGPELITPAAPVDVTPNYALGGQPTNVNFTINAVDAAGVEDVLMNQRGNLIRMIREAANENGERFLETVDTQSYGGSK